jgi:gas vesicle protein
MNTRLISRFLAGFVLGGLTGVSVALLLAPYSGEELRGRMRSETERIRSEVADAAAARRAELEAQLADLRAVRKPGPPAQPLPLPKQSPAAR